MFSLIQKFNFNDHIKCIVMKAFSILGFMNRICFEFTDSYALKSVTPGYAAHSSNIEFFKRNFCINFSAPWTGWDDAIGTFLFILHTKDRCMLISLEAMEIRRRNAMVFFF